MPEAADKIIDLYQRNAQDWDKKRGRSLFEKPWLDRFLALVKSKAMILDLGCGTGEPIARYFIESGHDVTGVDSSTNMIGFCKDRFPHQVWHVADMREISLPLKFDGIIAWDSFFFTSAMTISAVCFQSSVAMPRQEHR